MLTSFQLLTQITLLLFYSCQTIGYLVTIDIEKAFDSVDHTFLCAALKKIGFGESYIKWIQILLKGQESCVMNNGFTTKYFSLSCGTRQGLLHTYSSLLRKFCSYKYVT